VPHPLRLETESGVRCEQLIRPIDPCRPLCPWRHGPAALHGSHAGGTGLESRGVCNVCCARSPRQDGTVQPAVLVAAQLCGVSSVFKVGGAQAIAALAYGTESIPKVDKIFGPGNAYVTAAKQWVARDPAGAACDLPAGPSEVLVVADETARADFVAADLLAQAEHDVLAQGLLVTTSSVLAERVVEEIRAQRGHCSREWILTQSLSHCRSILVPDLETALQVVNEYAPEHLILEMREPHRWVGHVQHAGSVFLGAWSAEALGDYCTGSNHVLPTYGHARAFGGLSIRDFVKTISVQEVTSQGLRHLGPTAVTLAKLEGLDAHASAVTRRLEALGSAAYYQAGVAS
jgi:histidinol dehydrogenase